MLRTIVVSLLIIGAVLSSTAQVVVIAHPSVDESSLTLEALSGIYTLSNSSWSKGAPITVVDLRPELPSKRRFYAVLGKTSVDMRKEWMRAVLAGGARAPIGVDTEEEMLSKVSSTPGAVGYLSAAKATGAVKVLAKFD